MLTVSRPTDLLARGDRTIDRLVSVRRDAHHGRLQFQLDLHGAEEDRAYLSDTVLAENEVWVAEIDGALAGFIAIGAGSVIICTSAFPGPSPRTRCGPYSAC